MFLFAGGGERVSRVGRSKGAKSQKPPRNRKSNTHDNLFILGERLLILHLVLRRLVNLDPVVRQVAQDPRLELDHFLVRQGVGFRNDRDQVDALVQPPHELDVERFQPVDARARVVW